MEWIYHWFDIFDSYVQYNINPHKVAYGTTLQKQNKILNDIRYLMKNMKPVCRNAFKYFNQYSLEKSVFQNKNQRL